MIGIYWATMSSRQRAPRLDDRAQIFSARLTPHRSLSRTGFLILMLCLGGVSFVAGMVFLMMAPGRCSVFFGLDVLLI